MAKKPKTRKVLINDITVDFTLMWDCIEYSTGVTGNTIYTVSAKELAKLFQENGGNFMKHLGRALECADSNNAHIIMKGWFHIATTYVINFGNVKSVILV